MRKEILRQLQKRKYSRQQISTYCQGKTSSNSKLQFKQAITKTSNWTVSGNVTANGNLGIVM